MTAVLPDAVTRDQGAFRVAMTAELQRLHPRLRAVALYHRGWADADGTELPQGGGKLLRPGLALLGAAAVGGSPGTAMAGAIASELVHDFSLLHDDLMDGDTERRHRPTAWTVFGLGPAVLAGDGLLSLATTLVQESGAPGARDAERILSRAVARLVQGQADDLAFETQLDVGISDYLVMAGDKTAALLACAASIGACLAGAPLETVAGLAAYGEHLGLAFQLVDDLLGLWGDPHVTGKPVLSDLRARKKSAPVVMALAAGGPGAQQLRDHLAATGDPGDDALRGLAQLVADLGGTDLVAAEIERQLAQADTALEPLDITETAREDLTATARYVTARDR